MTRSKSCTGVLLARVSVSSHLCSVTLWVPSALVRYEMSITNIYSDCCAQRSSVRREPSPWQLFLPCIGKWPVHPVPYCTVCIPRTINTDIQNPFTIKTPNIWNHSSALTNLPSGIWRQSQYLWLPILLELPWGWSLAIWSHNFHWGSKPPITFYLLGTAEGSVWHLGCKKHAASTRKPGCAAS